MVNKPEDTLPLPWRVVLLVWPVPNLWLVVEFWQSQIAHYAVSTDGVLFMWLGAGFIFGCIMLVLQARAGWRTLHDTTKPRWERRKALWLLGIQVVTSLVMTYFSITAMTLLWQLGVRPNHWADTVVIAIAIITSTAVVWKFGLRRLGEATTLLWLAVGIKVMPQLLQGLWFVVYGSTGIHILTLSLVVLMTLCRYAVARTTLHYQKIDDTIATNRIAFCDLVAVSLMAVGWVIGQRVLQLPCVVGFANKPAGTRDDPGFFHARNTS